MGLIDSDDYGVPDLDIEDVREDFLYIWSKNIVVVDLLRDVNPQGGDYFIAAEARGTTRTQIQLNIQGVMSNAYKRAVQGITTTDEDIKAYALYTTDIQETDLIEFRTDYAVGTIQIKSGERFRIENYNKSSYAGQVAFKEFTLKRIDFKADNG